jgi:hypothetical protein
MTFEAFQDSVDGGAPILMVEFSIGATYWRYTSNDADYSWNGDDWISPPGGISRSNISGTADIRKQSIKITVARTLPFYQQTWGSDRAPSVDVMVKLYMLHTTDPDQQAQVEWVGRIKTPSRIKSTVVFTCDPVYTGVQSQGLRRCFGLNCAHVLYGRQCTLVADVFAINATLSSVDGTAIVAPEFFPPAGMSFNGGFISWTSPWGYTENRSIVAWDQSTKTATLAYGSPDLVPGLGIKIHPGCDHTLSNCGLFLNNLNYGGQPAIPEINPMDGATPVF